MRLTLTSIWLSIVRIFKRNKRYYNRPFDEVLIGDNLFGEGCAPPTEPLA